MYISKLNSRTVLDEVPVKAGECFGDGLVLRLYFGCWLLSSTI